MSVKCDKRQPQSVLMSYSIVVVAGGVAVLVAIAVAMRNIGVNVSICEVFTRAQLQAIQTTAQTTSVWAWAGVCVFVGMLAKGNASHTHIHICIQHFTHSEPFAESSFSSIL